MIPTNRKGSKTQVANHMNSITIKDNILCCTQMIQRRITSIRIIDINI